MGGPNPQGRGGTGALPRENVDKIDLEKHGLKAIYTSFFKGFSYITPSKSSYFDNNNGYLKHKNL